MDAYLTAEILKALTSGDLGKMIAYGLIFFFIWIEVRGMKKELHTLNKTVSKSFADGEARFEALESQTFDMNERLSKLERLTNS